MTGLRRFSDRRAAKVGGNLPLLTTHLGINDEVKRIAAEDLKRCRYSREEVALAISGQIGREVTVATVDAWVAESKVQHRFPLEVLPAWVRVTGSTRLLGLLCLESGHYFVTEAEHRLAEFGRRVIERERAVDRESRLKAVLLEAETV